MEARPPIDEETLGPVLEDFHRSQHGNLNMLAARFIHESGLPTGLVVYVAVMPETIEDLANLGLQLSEEEDAPEIGSSAVLRAEDGITIPVTLKKLQAGRDYTVESLKSKPSARGDEEDGWW